MGARPHILFMYPNIKFIIYQLNQSRQAAPYTPYELDWPNGWNDNSSKATLAPEEENVNFASQPITFLYVCLILLNRQSMIENWQI